MFPFLHYVESGDNETWFGMSVLAPEYIAHAMQYNNFVLIQTATDDEWDDPSLYVAREELFAA
jgi:hypothetical protein